MAPRSSSRRTAEMLRAAIGFVASIFVLVTLVFTVAAPAAWPALAGALVFASGCIFERRYHAGRAATYTAGLTQTGERFVDPETGRVMAVWIHHPTGERHYIDEGVPPGSAR
jgi:hypothetical protein